MEARVEIQCPACSELILASAKKCKHCGEWLRGDDALRAAEGPEHDTMSEAGRSMATRPTMFLLVKNSDVSPDPTSAFPLVSGELLGTLRVGEILHVFLPAGRHRLRFGIAPYDTPFEIDISSAGGGKHELRWDYGRWVVATPTEQSGKVEHAPRESSEGMEMAGIGLMGLAAVLMLYSLNMSTTVTTDARDFGFGVRVPSMTVNNIGLMQDKQNMLIVSGFVGLLGLGLFVSGKKG